MALAISSLYEVEWCKATLTLDPVITSRDLSSLSIKRSGTCLEWPAHYLFSCVNGVMHINTLVTLPVMCLFSLS